MSVPLPIFALERKYKLWGFIPHQSWVQSVEYSLQEVTHTWHLVMLSDYPGELEESQQKGHIMLHTEVWHQLSPLLSNLPHRGPTRGSAGTRSTPGMQTLVFCPHNHLTQETALLKGAEEVLNTHRTLKKKLFFSFTGYTTLRDLHLKSLVSPFFSLNFLFSTLSHRQRQPQCLYWEPLLILSWTFKIRVEPQNSPKFLPEWLFWVEHLDTVLDRWSQEAYALASLCGFLSRNLQVIHNTGYGRPQPLHHESPLRLYSL